MRRQLALQVAAVTVMVALAFLIPLGILVSELAADRALTRAERDAESVARFVAVLAPTQGVDGALAALRTDRLNESDLSVITADGTVLGAPVPIGEDLSGAQGGVAYREVVSGGQAVYVPLVQPDGTTAVVRVFVADDVLTEGVARSWVTLVGLGLVLSVLAVLLFDRLGRTVVNAIDDLYEVTEQLGSGDSHARITPSGPPEIVTVGEGLNRLAARIDELLQEERETAANLSHRLRTPLAAARLTVEGETDPVIREQLLDDLDRLDRTVDHVISEARRGERQEKSEIIDLAELTRKRVEFWTALAEDQGRDVGLNVSDERLTVKLPPNDAAAAIDALLTNALSHTPARAPIAVAVFSHTDGNILLTVEDGGSGFPDAGVLERGRSDADSTGLGLDIVAQTARAAGGSIQLGSSKRLGGAMVVVRFPRTAPIAVVPERSGWRWSRHG